MKIGLLRLLHPGYSTQRFKQWLVSLRRCLMHLRLGLIVQMPFLIRRAWRKNSLALSRDDSLLRCGIGMMAQFMSNCMCATPHNSERGATYLISVLTFTQSTSYSFFSASLICLLFALISQMKTRVLFSSIFFIALSVFSG